MIPDAYPPIQDGDFATPSLFNDRFLLAWQQFDALNADIAANSAALSDLSFDDRYSLLSHNHDASYLRLSGGTLTGPLSVSSGLVIGATSVDPAFVLDTSKGAARTGDLTVASPDSNSYVVRRVRSFAVPTSYMDILRLGTVGSYRITVAGADNSAGPRSMGFYEISAVVSSDYMTLGTATNRIHLSGEGLDIAWAGVTGSYSTAGAVLRMRAQQSTSDIWIVGVEEYGRDTRAPITWLV